MTRILHVLLSLALAIALGACRGPDPAEIGGEATLRQLGLAEGGRVCEGPDGNLLASTDILAEPDSRMHRIGDCLNPLYPVYVPQRDIDRPRGEQDLYIRVAQDRYLQLHPEGTAE